jgi:hypothetical protein
MMLVACQAGSTISVAHPKGELRGYVNALSANPKAVAKRTCHVKFSATRATRQKDDEALAHRIASRRGDVAAEVASFAVVEGWISTILGRAMSVVADFPPENKITSLLGIVDLYLDRGDFRTALPVARDVLTDSWFPGTSVEVFMRVKRIAVHLADDEEYKSALELLRLSEIRLRPRESPKIAKTRLALLVLLEDIATRGGMLDDARRCVRHPPGRFIEVPGCWVPSPCLLIITPFGWTEL